MSEVPLESSRRAVSKYQGGCRSTRGPLILNKTSTGTDNVGDSAVLSGARTHTAAAPFRRFFGALALLVRAWNPVVIGTRAVPEHPRASMPSLIHPSRPPTRTLPAPTAWIVSPACHCRIFTESADTVLRASSSACTSWSQVLILTCSAHFLPDPST